MRPHKIEFDRYQTWVDLDAIQSISEISGTQRFVPGNQPIVRDGTFYIQFALRDNSVFYGKDYAFEDQFNKIKYEHQKLLNAWMNRDAA